MLCVTEMAFDVSLQEGNGSGKTGMYTILYFERRFFTHESKHAIVPLK